MDLTNDIISYIFTEKQLSLPGLGILTLSKTSAYRSPSKNKISGPIFTIELIDQKHEDDLNSKFYQFIANKNNKSTKKAKSELNKYSIGILNDLANFNEAKIENLGVFKHLNEKVSFEFSPIFEDLLKESYPEFPLLLISRNKNETSTEVTTNNTIITLPTQQKKEYKTNWIFPLIVLTMISLGFVCLMYCLSSIFEKSTNKNTSITPVIIDTVNINDAKPDIVNTKKVTTIDSIELVKNKSVEESTIDDTNSNSSTNSQITKSDLEIINLDELILMGPDLKNQFNRSCIIIVGSFKRQRNSNRMKNRLIKANFMPYIEKYGQYYRTGVVFDCNEKPLFSFLEDLRTTIDKGSWVLKYK